jgi:hypothetical protein
MKSKRAKPKKTVRPLAYAIVEIHHRENHTFIIVKEIMVIDRDRPLLGDIRRIRKGR